MPELEWISRLRTGLLSPPRVPLPPPDARPAAVLVLVTATTAPRVVVMERAATLRNHAGQVSFPGGAEDPGDADAVATALREANEEIGLDPQSTSVLGLLPDMWVAPSNFRVTPVLATWDNPHELVNADSEVVRVMLPEMSVLANPDNRYRIRLSTGYAGPAFLVHDTNAPTLIWGFTAAVLDVVLRLGGWHVPWNRARELPYPL